MSSNNQSTDKNNKNGNNTNNESDDSDDNQTHKIPYRRDRTPSIVVQSLGLSFHKDSNITESIELPNDEEDNSQNSNSSETTDPKSSTSGIDEIQNTAGGVDSSSGSAKGSLSSLPNSSPVSNIKTPSPKPLPASSNRRLSLNIGSTAPRRQSLTVDGLSSFVNPAYKDFNLSSGNATGSLRNKVALKPGHSLMGWIRLASTSKDLSGTNGKTFEVTPEELAKHDKEEDCWVALKGNVYNVTTYLQYHPGGVEELLRGAGRDATDLFNEVHRWVNYESILAKCLIGPYKLDSPLTPGGGRTSFSTMTTNSTQQQPSSNTFTKPTTGNRRDPTVAQKPPRRQSIALTVPSPNKYQSLLLSNSSTTNINQIQQTPTYVIMQDKSCIKLKIQDLSTLPIIRSRHLICDFNEKMELHLSVILSYDWLYRVHLRLDQPINVNIKAELSSDDGTITVQLNKREAAIWNKIGTSLDLNDSLCEMTLADKFFRPCQLLSKQKLTHDTYMFEFKLENTLMYIPIGWHILMREHKSSTKQSNLCNNNDENIDDDDETKSQQENSKNYLDDYRVHKNYTPVLKDLNNDGLTDESGFMNRLYFIIKIYPNGLLTSKLNQLNIGDNVDISDYQTVDFDIESQIMNPKHWFLFAAGTGITPFCRIISYLLSQTSENNVKSVHLIFFNKTQKDIIWKNEWDKLSSEHELKFKVTYVLSEDGGEEEKGGNKVWTGKRGRISRQLVANLVDSYSPDEIQLLACGPKVFTQLTKSITNELNLGEKLYVFHG